MGDPVNTSSMSLMKGEHTHKCTIINDIEFKKSIEFKNSALGIEPFQKNFGPCDS